MSNFWVIMDDRVEKDRKLESAAMSGRHWRGAAGIEAEKQYDSNGTLSGLIWLCSAGPIRKVWRKSIK